MTGGSGITTGARPGGYGGRSRPTGGGSGVLWVGSFTISLDAREDERPAGAGSAVRLGSVEEGRVAADGVCAGACCVRPCEPPAAPAA